MKEQVVAVEGRFTLIRRQNCKESLGVFEKFDLVLKRGEDIIKENRGCIGESSAKYWEDELRDLAKKLNILYDAKQTNPSEAEFIDMWIERLICG
jgi:hypothetical protein